MTTDLENLKAAYASWDASKGTDTGPWMNLLDDVVALTSMGDDAKGLMFAKSGTARDHVVAYFAGLAKDWKMVHWTPEAFVVEGARIAMFGRCAWTHKVTGKTAEVRIAHLWLFRDGKAVEFTEIFDSARAVAAAS